MFNEKLLNDLNLSINQGLAYIQNKKTSWFKDKKYHAFVKNYDVNYDYCSDLNLEIVDYCSLSLNKESFIIEIDELQVHSDFKYNEMTDSEGIVLSDYGYHLFNIFNDNLTKLYNFPILLDAVYYEEDSSHMTFTIKINCDD